MNTLADLPAFALAQHARLVTLACPLQPDLVAGLVAEQFIGREAVGELFMFALDVLTTAADCDIDALIGAELAWTLLQPDGSRRTWHGLCTHAGVRGADGGLARYRLRLEPALAQLQHRRDSHIFQDMDARAIVLDVLADYPAVRCTFDVTRTLMQRPACVQYRETDFAFLCRLLAAEGLNWRFDHAEDSHVLVVFDAQATVPAMPGGDVLRFHGVRATELDDAIDAWHVRRSVQPNGVALSRWDPAQLIAPASEQRSALNAGELPALSIFDGSGECSAATAPDSLPVLQAFERGNKIYAGAGAVRRLAPGHGFTLTQHAHYPAGENEFTVLSVEHAARNNLRTGIKGAAATLDGGTYRNTFACVRATVALAPAAAALPHPVTACGVQAALVVGAPGAVATATRDYQVKVQFPWQRGARPNPGGLSHPGARGGNAPGDAASGAWMRVAEALAGPNWGSQFTPRIGTEVLIPFIEGNVDRAVITGQLHNGVDAPPFPAGVDAPAGDVGVLSGIQTGNFNGGAGNQWLLDDTPGQLRTRLATSHAASELHLGHLVQQAVGSGTRGAPRGSGFELRTDAWATLRGAQGVLLSTSVRPVTGSSVTSTQMDAQEAVALLKGGAALNDALQECVAQHQALGSADASKAQATCIKGANPRQAGKYPGPVNGQPASKAQPGVRELDDSQPVERFDAAAILFDAAAAMNWATAGAQVISAGQQVHWTTQADVHIAAGKTCSAAAGRSASLFAHAGGVQVFAANGPVSVQAHTAGLEIIADKEVEVLSVREVIAVQAKTKIVLQAGEASITLDGGDITFACPGKFTAKGGKKVFDAGASEGANLLNLPGTLAEEAKHWIALHYMDPELAEGIPDVDYEIHFENAPMLTGTLDDSGKARHENVANRPVKKVLYKPRKPGAEKPYDPFEDLLIGD
jgi:type VI secretion system secreted protein VgrG